MKALKKAIINTSSEASSESADPWGRMKRKRKRKKKHDFKKLKRKAIRETRKAENETKRTRRRAGKGKTVKTNEQGKVMHGCNGSSCKSGAKQADPGI